MTTFESLLANKPVVPPSQNTASFNKLLGIQTPTLPNAPQSEFNIDTSAPIPYTQTPTPSVPSTTPLVYAPKPTAGQIYAPTAPTPVATPTPPISKTYLEPSFTGNDATNDKVDAQNVKDATGKIDPNAVRDYYLSMHQAEIDAVNQIYAQQYGLAQQQGLGRLGSTAAIDARSGTLGSPTAVADNNNQVGANNDILAGIQAEKAAKIGAILGTVSDQVAADLKTKNEAKKQGADSHIAYLASEATRKSTNTSNFAKSLLAQGLTLDDVGKDNLAKTASDFGVPVTDLITAYNDAKTTKDATDAKNASDTQFNLSEGESRYDANGNVIASKEKTYKPDASADLSGTGNPAVDSWVNLLNSGKAKNSDVPATLRNAVAVARANAGVSGELSDTGKSAVSIIDQLLARNTDTITGVKGITNYLPGTEAQRTKNLYNQLQGIVSLQNRQQLKGQGAISDFEFKVLQDAASSLGTNLSNEDFKSELTKLRNNLVEGNTNPETSSPNIVSSPDGDVEIID